METRLVLVCARMQPEDVVEPVHAIQQDHFDVPDEQCTAPKVQWGPRGAFPDHTALLLADRGASAQGPYTLNPFSLHFLCIGVNLLIHVVEGAFMFTVLAFLDSGTLMTLRNTLAEKAQILRAEFDSDIQQESQKAPRLAKVAGLEQHALVVCDVWRTCAKNAVPELKAINLSLRQGECFGLLGAHNARKTVLLEVLSGLATHSAGDAYSQKFVLSQGPRKWQSQIGYCPQQDCLLSNLTVQDHLVLFARLRGLPGGRLRDYVNNMLKTFRLQEKGRECPRDMSLSDKRKLSLAIALTGTPSLVFLDEPLQGVDAVTHQRLYQVIQHLCKKSKTTFLYASTGMRQLELMCKRLAIIVDGHLQCIGTIDHLREKFGQGMTVKIQLSGPEKERVLEVQPVMTALFPDSRLIYYHRGLLSFEMYEKRPWSEVFSSISLLLQGFRCDYVLVSETMLEDIYLAFSKSYYHGTTNRPRSVF
ncbi:phospholipid-transporting ATPase ABCA3-like isoform X2 [Haemaphysalis longicornis]